jgi:hypothetical protein
MPETRVAQTRAASFRMRYSQVRTMNPLSGNFNHQSKVLPPPGPPEADTAPRAVLILGEILGKPVSIRLIGQGPSAPHAASWARLDHLQARDPAGRQG